jgi:hypothetical protein
MKTIHKYIVTGRNETLMPIGAKILHVNMQGRDICMWALVDKEVMQEYRTFEVVGTGWELDENMFYVGTCFDSDSFVWHIMEII